MEVHQPMSEKKSLPAAIVSHIAQQLATPVPGIRATIDLLDAGGTVPFIARYRKEVTGNLDEVALSAIQERLTYFPRTGTAARNHSRQHCRSGETYPRARSTDRHGTGQANARRLVPSVPAKAPHQGDNRAGEGTGVAGRFSLEAAESGRSFGRVCRVVYQLGEGRCLSRRGT
jgi:hypothetical protein